MTIVAIFFSGFACGGLFVGLMVYLDRADRGRPAATARQLRQADRRNRADLSKAGVLVDARHLFAPGRERSQ